MHRTPGIPIWKTAPMLRLLLPLILGILLYWYFPVLIWVILFSLVSFISGYFLFLLLPLSVRFKIQWLQGLLIHLIICCLGMLITWQADIRHQNNWYGHRYRSGDYLIVQINEAPVQKTKTWKAEVIIEAIVHNDSSLPASGKMLVYFFKDSGMSNLHYGDRILIHKDPQNIKNSGNPGAFNYERYAAMQQIFQQVYVKQEDWAKLNGNAGNPFQQFLYTTRNNILAALQRNINNSKDELGIAEALLIGYTNDLDRDLVQAYSNTGVVHIIAISGMHLALIYVLLIWIFSRVPLIKQSKLLQTILILGCLWLFSLLTGGAASVLRSAVMFSFIHIGNNFVRKTSIYNALASSAFVLLCYNPYYLWDVGFQLSYLALIGIVVFQKPVYGLLHIKNKWLDKIWQLAAVSLAAQILTFPICIFYFHQFPLLFLLANILVVPLSSIILYAEIMLITCAWFHPLAVWVGKVTTGMLLLMNTLIEKINQLSFAVWDNISATVLSTVMLYMILTCWAAWLLNKHRNSFIVGLLFLMLFISLHTYQDWKVLNQQVLIVYNVTKHRAIDIIEGANCRFIGDSVMHADQHLQQLNLKPARLFWHVSAEQSNGEQAKDLVHFYQLHGTRIALINGSTKFDPLVKKIDLNLIVISGNPSINIPELAMVFNCKQFVFDASNSLWKIGKWQADCSALHLQCHSVPAQGAFVTDL
jgi:competence protein ComEC